VQKLPIVKIVNSVMWHGLNSIAANVFSLAVRWVIKALNFQTASEL
jgi:ribosomal protein S7